MTTRELELKLRKNGENPAVHKKPIKSPKWLHEYMSHIAEIENINVNYKRDIHSITFENGYKFESEYFFEDRFYQNNAIICLNSSNENNGHKNLINIPDNVFMINDKGERIWTFKRSFIFPDRHTPVNHMGISYDKNELYLFVYDDKHYRPQYVLDAETGRLLQRKEILFPSWRKSVKITFGRRKNKSSRGKE